MNIGEVYGKLTVVSDKYKKQGNDSVYFVDCSCECGSGVKSYRTASLKKKKSPTQSCGCKRYEVMPVVGDTYGRLTITEDIGVVGGDRRVVCECSCGTENFQVLLRSIRHGETKSCGCLQKEVNQSRVKHNQTCSPTYYSWQAMKTRCLNPNSDNFQNYGGRGITVCERWLNSFENFLEDMGERPEGMTLDRIDVNGNYCKDNCRWTTNSLQVFNRRKYGKASSKYIGVTKSADGRYWRVSLSKDRVVVFTGQFSTELEAAMAYDEACLMFYGTRKNFPVKDNNGEDPEQ